MSELLSIGEGQITPQDAQARVITFPAENRGLISVPEAKSERNDLPEPTPLFPTVESASPEVPTEGEEAEPKTPSWKESMAELNEAQHFAAEVSFTTDLLKLLQADTEKSKGFYNLAARGRDIYITHDEDTTSFHAGRLFDAYIAHLASSETEEPERFPRETLEDRFVARRFEELLPEIESLRDGTFSGAKGWDMGDARKIRRGAHTEFNKLPDELKSHIYKQIGLPEETTLEKGGRWGLTVGTNVGSAIALDAVAVGLGALAVKYNGHLLDGQSWEVAYAVLIASYGVYFKGLKDAWEENFKQLEENDFSTSIISKMFYDWAKTKTENKTVQKALASTGYTLYDLILEIPYYVGAIAVNSLSDSHNSGVALLAGANVGGGIFEYGKAKVSQAIRTRNDKRHMHNREVTEQAAHQQNALTVASAPAIVPAYAEGD